MLPATELKAVRPTILWFWQQQPRAKQSGFTQQTSAISRLWLKINCADGSLLPDPTPRSPALFGIKPALGLAEAVKKERIIRDGFFDEPLDQKHFGAVDHRVHTLLKSLHRGEGLE